MKTIQRFPTGFAHVATSKGDKEIPKGKIWLTLVTVEVVELEEKDMETKFPILAGVPSSLKDRKHRNLLKKCLRMTEEHISANRDNLYSD